MGRVGERAKDSLCWATFFGATQVSLTWVWRVAVGLAALPGASLGAGTISRCGGGGPGGGWLGGGGVALWAALGLGSDHPCVSAGCIIVGEPLGA